MPGDRKIRASDADRDAAATSLREHMVAGRLSADEFGERLDKAYAATNLGDLDDILADLPKVDLARPGDRSLMRAAPGSPPVGRGGLAGPAGGRFPATWRGPLGSWLAISLVLVAIWVVSQVPGLPWFLWVILPLGALMLGRAIAGTSARRAGRDQAWRRHGHRRWQ